MFWQVGSRRYILNFEDYIFKVLAAQYKHIHHVFWSSAMNNFVHNNEFLMLMHFQSIATNPTLKEFELTALCMRQMDGRIDDGGTDRRWDGWDIWINEKINAVKF